MKSLSNLRFASIDIGSNAVRLLLSTVFEDGHPPLVKKESLVRMPIRLGDDAFTNHRISGGKVEQLLETMKAFRHLITAYRPLDCMACATSAVREAENGPEIIRDIKEQSGISVEIIGGRREAEILFATHFEKTLEEDSSCLYIDVGGGSTELTFFSKDVPPASRSFDIGTIRILSGLVSENSWKDMKRWIKENQTSMKPASAIGSGGNINKIFRLARKKEKKPLFFKEIKNIYEDLKSCPLMDRILVWGLRPDRADVIVPAAEIYLSVMKWAGIKIIYVPQFGLSDGLIRIMYEEHKNR